MNFESTILCVDDDDDDLFFIRDVIHSHSLSIKIAEARNGWEAIKFLDDAQAKNSFPCLIIMDMNMPRMDGKQTINKILENSTLAKIPIVVFTTSSNLVDKEYFENKGIHFITKPFDFQVFTNQIIKVLMYCAEIK